MTLSVGTLPLQSTESLLSAVSAALQKLDHIMTPSVDSLLNQLVPLKTSGNIAISAAKPAVIEAVVLANSPLMKSPEGKPQITVTLSNNQQRYELTTQVPIPVGAKVELKIAPNNQAILLSINNTKVAKATGQPGTSTTFTGSAPVSLDTNHIIKGTSTALLDNKPNPAAYKPVDVNQLSRQLIERSVRQVLPQQQPLRTLLPLIQAVMKEPQALPKDLAISLKHLMRQIPTAEQLQHPKPVKQAVQNSGIFFESKLSKQPPAPNNQTAIKSHTNSHRNPHRNPNTPINQDIKGLIERVLPQIDKATRPHSSPVTQDNSTPAPSVTSQAGTPQLPDFSQLPPQQAGSQTNPLDSKAPSTSKEQSLDVLLRQLGRQLLATLARTQLNQLETLGHRQVLSNDPQAPINSWNLEIPILHGSQVDNLELQIEERLAQQQQKDQAEQTKQWTVMLNFDLHQLGKLQTQLVITGKSVNATVWSEQKETHQQVQQHIQELQSSLEKVGVTVNSVDCRIGVAPKGRQPLYQQLVDVRT